MSIKSTILNRRSIYQFQSKVVPFTSIEECLEAAIWAPNHKLTQPWFFWVISDETQSKLASIYAELRAQKRSKDCPQEYDSIYLSAIEKFNKIPQVVMVGQKKTSDPVLAKEDYAACSCAIQNFSLMAWELGLGSQWSTGPIIQDQRTYALINADQSEYELIGAVFMGYPSKQTTSKRNRLETVYKRI